MPINITLPLEKTEGAIRNGQIRDTDNIGTQETGRTMIDITLHRTQNYNPDDNSSDTKNKTILAQLAIPVVSLLNNTNITC
jgi:hypothetical protein